MLQLAFLIISIFASIFVIVIFGVVNIILNASSAKKEREWHVVNYRPVSPSKPKQPQATPKPKLPVNEKKYLTVEEFVKKNLNLLDKLIESKKNFSLSEELLKDLDNSGRNGLADWFMNMPVVDTVINSNTVFKVFIVSR